jgi:putative transcriptional regulator
MTPGERIIAGLDDALVYAVGDESRGRTTRVSVPEHVDVKAIRQRLRLSQAEFAHRYGFSLSAVRHWEQQRRHPEGSARMLLTIIDKEPEAVERALAARSLSTQWEHGTYCPS